MRSFIPGSGRTRHNGRVRHSKIFIVRREHTSVFLKGLAHAGQPFMVRSHSTIPRKLAISGASVALSTPVAAILTSSNVVPGFSNNCIISVSYTHLRAHETRHDLVCR